MRLQMFAAASLASIVTLVGGGAQAAVELTSFGGSALPSPGAFKAQGVSGVATLVTEEVAAPGAPGFSLPVQSPTNEKMRFQPLPPVPLITAVSAIPEPAGWTLMLAGFGGLGGLLRRRRQLAAA